MKFLIILFLIMLLVGHLCQVHDKKEEQKRIEEAQQKLLCDAAVSERQFRYETKRIQTRIFEMLKRQFEEVKILENVAIEYKDNVYTIPLIGLTEKGILVFQLVDHPGKALFGKLSDKVWKIAQSERCAQEIPNAAWQAIDYSFMIKQLSNIDTKPIAVVSKYTPMNIIDNRYGQRVILEENLEQELEFMCKNSAHALPDVYITKAKEKLLALNSTARA